MDCFGATDTGRVRDANEDQFLIAALNKSMRVEMSSLNMSDTTRLFGTTQGHLLLVADGMGGYAGGKRASELTVSTIATYILNSLDWYFRLSSECEDDFAEDLKGALGRAQQRLADAVRANPEFAHMGTTLTMAFVVWPRAYVVHVGDSRCYLLREGRLNQLTLDHTVAQMYRDAGMPCDDEDSARFRHTLYNAIGGESGELDVDIHRIDLQQGDTLLLCSDGLSNAVAGAKIKALCERSSTAREACTQLIRAANAEGGTDNITVIVARPGPACESDAALAEATMPLEQLLEDRPPREASLRDTDAFEVQPQS